jgi:FAD/FMN-containing dehydrogenase
MSHQLPGDHSAKHEDDVLSEESISRRKFLVQSAAATGSLVLGASGVLAQESKSVTGKKYDFSKLQAQLKGDVVSAASPNFAEVTRAMVWNEIKPDRAPDCIVRVKSVDDVIAAVNFARENGLKIAVHGGGHTWVGLAVRNGGMTIDLTALNECVIDPENRKAQVQPVLSNRDVLHMLAAKGMSFPTGHCPTVKMSGYLLNGGLSWNLAEWGPAVYSVEAYEFVTADGKLVTASDKEHSDLYWAARGCGPGMFAVAVRYHLKLFPLPKAITTSNYWFHLADLKEVVEKVTAIGWDLTSKIELSIFMMAAPSDIADKFKDENNMCCMVSAVAFVDSEAEAESALQPLENAELLNKCVKKAAFVPSNVDMLSDASGASWPEGLRNLVENSFENGKAVDMYMALKDQMLKCPSQKSVIVFVHSTGKRNILSCGPEVACSAAGNYYGGTWTMWEYEKDDAANMKWHKETTELMKKHVTGYYVGETDYVTNRGQLESAYTVEKAQRLEQIRQKYDPTGVFQGFTGGLSKA